MENEPNNMDVTTDSWGWGKIIKHVLLPKPKGSPKAGKKEIGARIAIAGACGLIAFSMFSRGGLPDCDADESVNLVEQIVGDMSSLRIAGVQFVSLEGIRELGYNERTEIRSCSAVLVTNRGENDSTYSIVWADKEKGEYYIEFEIF
ncbi:hypothetical protein MFKK_20200 [Halopseudomonas aestusnigri]|uniref:hypothetical protein n=1 Tax=Halopseudomonas TaxID=2901189 RepID=UPI0022B6E262|nr:MULTISPECIES: hypothetical protein [Halopseudomonas]BDX19210.1 hypothetical protein MFKK_20200 [Halopseudomonas aestusnigri]